MAVYSINDIATLTGIKAPTLRIWEKRYGLQISRRSPDNVRYYLDEDLKRIINIAILNKSGMKISRIAQLSWSEIRKLVTEKSDVHHSHESDLDTLSLSLINLDQGRFDKIFSINCEQNGFRWALENLIFPLFDKLNDMYLTGTIKPVHEAFLNYMLKGKIMAEVERIRSGSPFSAPDYILFQPIHSKEELGVMLLNYFLLSSGKTTLNLGNNISAEDIIEAYQHHKVKHIIGLFNAEMRHDEIKAFLQTILDKCPRSDMIVSGFDIYREGIKETDRLIVMPDLNSITTFLHRDQPVAEGN